MKRGVLLLTLGAAVASAVVAAALVGAVGPSGAKASSHREAPLIADDPAADNTDVYAFVSPDKPNTVTIIANYIPFEDPAGGPNYYRFDPTVLYAFNIDNNGDGREDVAYQFRFKTAGRRIRTPSSTTPGRSTRRRTRLQPERQADVLRHAGDGKSGSTTLGSNLGVPPANIGPRSNSSDVRARTRASSTSAATARSSPVRATIRSSSTSGSIFDLGGPAAVQLAAHLIPLANEPRDGRRPELQHPHDRDPGSEDGSAQGSARGRDDRRSTPARAGRRSGSSAVTATFDAERTAGSRSRGSATRSSTRSSSRSGRRTTGTRPTRARTSSSRTGTRTPELAGLVNGLYPVLDDTPTSGRGDLVAVLLTGVSDAQPHRQHEGRPAPPEHAVHGAARRHGGPSRAARRGVLWASRTGAGSRTT